MFKREDFLAVRHASMTQVRLPRLAGRVSASDRFSRRVRFRFFRMFSGWHLGLTFYRGWDRILARACEDISGILPGDLDFHWVQLEERDGMLHLYYTVGERVQHVVEIEPPSRSVAGISFFVPAGELVQHINATVDEAERLSGEACIVCGSRAERAEYFGRTLPVCGLHRPGDLNRGGEEGLAGLWRTAIDWEEGVGRRSR